MYRSAYRILMVLPLMFCSVGIYLGIRAWASPKTDINPITISESTTWVTEHVDEDGFVDYEEAINVRQSQGKSPDQNAALGLVRAFGLSSLSEKNRMQYLHDLQADVSEIVGDDGQPDAANRHFETLADLANGHGASELLNKVYDKPWARNEQDMARVNEWLASNDLPVKAALEAIDLPDFYFPVHRDVVNDWFFVGNQQFLNKCRELSTFLNIRAMRALGENDIESAARDSLAIRKLARKLSAGAMPFELYVSYEIELRAVSIEKRLLNGGAMTAEQAIAYRDRLKTLPTRGDMAEKLNSGLRLMMLDSVNRLAKQKFAPTDSQQNQQPRHRDPYVLFKKFNVDFDEAMRQVNLRLDQVIDAIVQPCARDRVNALRQIGIRPPQKPALALVSELLMRSSSARGKILADMITGYVLPAQESFVLKECDLAAYDVLIPLAFTLRARNENGSAYPASIAELTPDLIAEIPLSPFDLSPLEYEKTESGFELRFPEPVGLQLPNGTELPKVVVGSPEYEATDQ